MKALFRADMNATIGSGHLSRCLTLAAALAHRGVACTFAVSNPSGSTTDWIAREGHAAVAVLSAHDPAEIGSLAADVELLIVDGYDFDASYQSALRGPRRLVVVLDDLAAKTSADVVINGNLYAADLAYDVERDVVLMVGPEFALVREEFVTARSERSERRRAGTVEQRAPRLLVTMGGADPTAETEKVIASLDVGLTEVSEIRVVVGPVNRRLEEIRAVAARSRHRVEVLVDVRNMGEQMTWSDVAISASGGTCLELCCVGVAAAVVVVADNQRLVANALHARSLVTVLPDSLAAGATAAGLIADVRSREAMEDRQRALVDGLGKDRVADSLIREIA